MTNLKKIPPKEELPIFLKKVESFARRLARSPKIQNVVLMSDVLSQLHRNRPFYTSDQEIVKTIFRIHDQNISSPNPLMRKQIQIASIFGFLGVPPRDMSTAKQIMDRMFLMKNLTEVRPAFKSLTQRMISLYESLDYKNQDDNLAIAFRLKALLQIIRDMPSKQKNADQRWVHENAKRLAKAQPMLKQLPDLFPATPRKVTSFDPPRGPVSVYPRVAHPKKTIQFSSQYE